MLAEDEMRWLLVQPPHDIVSSPLHGGRRMPIHEVIKAAMRGGPDGDAGFQAAISTPTTGGSGGAAVSPSQAAIDRLSKADYDQLQKTGGLDGVTRAESPTIRAKQVQNAGVTSIHLAPNKETGEYEPSSGPSYGLDKEPEQQQAAAARNPWILLDR